MFDSLFSTSQDWVLTFVRAALAIVIFPHGAQKLLGWFGGFGFKGTMGFFTQNLRIPGLVAFLVIVIEFFGPLLLAAGLGTRLAAFAIAVVMIGAVLKLHLGAGFFMNWNGNQKGEGYEYHLLAVALAAVLVIRGGGFASVDGFLFR